MNIVYFIPHLREASGINRVLNIKANYLADVLKYKVTIITYRQYDSIIFFPFNKNVKLVHFDLDDPTFRVKSLPFIEKRRQIKKFMSNYKNLVEHYLLENKTDICISLFLGAEYKFLHEIKDKSKKILEFHMNFDNSPFKLLNKTFRLSNFRSIIQINQLRNKLEKYDQFVVLTDGDAQNWKKYFSKVIVIANPLTIKQDHRAPLLSNKKAIAVGRLEKEKGFDYLIDAWKTVNKQHPDWLLNIYGEGSLENNLSTQIKHSNLENCIYIKKAVSNIAEKYLESSVFILSSRNEGFGLVLMEAIALGIPSVSFNCKFGPEELINDGDNGLLVEAGNVEALAAKIITIIENENLRKIISRSAALSTQKYNVSKIMEKWNLLFKSLAN